MEEDAFPEKGRKNLHHVTLTLYFFCVFLSTSSAEYKKVYLMHFIDKSNIFCVLVSFSLFCLFVFFSSTTHRLFFNKFQLGWGMGGDEGRSARKRLEGAEKCIMGTTACIKEEQCIGPGSGGGM